MRGDLELHLLIGKSEGSPIGSNQSPGAQGIATPVGLAQLIVHELASVTELKSEPIPSHLVSPQRAGAPFTVEPTQSLDAIGAIANPHGSLSGHSRKRIVVRSVPDFGTL